MSIRVRFAPSPTGKVHIGNIRTAIFNWLYARHTGGSFILRVEDTDLERSTPEAVQALLECMQWLKLDYDEEIMYQSKRREAHEAAVAQLLADKNAYFPPTKEGEAVPTIFRIPIETADIPAIREVGTEEIFTHNESPVTIDLTGLSYAQVSRKGKPVPQSCCLAGVRDLKLYDPEDNLIFELEPELNAILAGEKSFVLENCARMTFLRKEVFFVDLIKGEMAKPLDSMKDLVIVRSDGSPVFHIANVCDDLAQNITHIIRGDDHVENTYRHILLFNALAEKAPEYAHMPMIVNDAGKPFSKRDGDAFVGDFRDKGFLPDALFNYLSLLGWSPGDDREKMTRNEMIEAFEITRVKSAPARFDAKKLLDMNNSYIDDLSSEEFTAIAGQFYDKPVDKDAFAAVAAAMQGRTGVMTDVAQWDYFFSEELEYPEKPFKKQFKKPENREGLQLLAHKFAVSTGFNSEDVMNCLKNATAELGLGEYQLFQPLRLALSGTGSGLDLEEIAVLLGQASCIRRIENAIKYYEENAAEQE